MISLTEQMESPIAGPRALNLMEAEVPQALGDLPAGAKWFNEARFGMFVHFGLYSQHGLGEWHMYYDRVPAAEYNKLADKFSPSAFNARELVALARRAGAGYVVFGARHHEGYCLWDTDTTDFKSSHYLDGRDFVREVVDACRAAGLRVGIYYSIMSWQWQAIFDGPVKDPEGWKGMVEETHEQVRELMSHYGRIDYLWYDGCVVPGMGDASIRVRYWRSRELNAMVRQLQPGILINDRAGLPEDVTTPEQHLTPGPGGRLWECCQTMGTSWGWRDDEVDIKSSAALIRQLVYCARYGGNFLLNIGPRGDGSIDESQVARMEAIGDWMATNGEAIRGSERTPYTEALHVIGEATARASKVYFHISAWSEAPHRIAGITSQILSARLLGHDEILRVEQKSDGTATIFNLPVWLEIDAPYVLELELDGPVPQTSPPTLLHEEETGRYLPAEAPLNSVEDWEMAREQRLAFDVAAPGTYDFEFSVISKEAAPLQARLDGGSARHLQVSCGEYPVTLRLKNLNLAAGRHRLDLRSSQTLFAAYVWRLQPQWTVLPANRWKVIGPFPTGFHPLSPSSAAREALGTDFPPEKDFDPDASYPGAGDRLVRWQDSLLVDDTVNFARICGTEEYGVCYARMIVVAPEAMSLDVLLACDWWANLFVNGRKVKSLRDPKSEAEDGAWFSDWKPIPARVSLREGKNVFLVKCHPGSTDNWFKFFYNNPGDIVFER